jgi:dUTPase
MVKYPLLLNKILEKYHSAMVLNLFIEGDDNLLKNMYQEAVEKHNLKMANDNYPDAGFDIFAPNKVDCFTNCVNKINFGVRCFAKMVNSKNDLLSEYNTGFYMYPRSSISKTSLRLANSVGIIDSGYRGSLIGAFDCFHKIDVESKDYEPWDSDYIVEKYDRLVQICAPHLVPIFVVIMNDINTDTLRGEGGFGSSGK